MDAKQYDDGRWLGDSEVAQIVRARDWSQTPLGALETWPQSLKTALCICLHSSSPVALYWGPDFTAIYNDVCARLIGDRHPAAIGKPAPLIYPDIWDTIGPLFVTVLNQGLSTGSRNQVLQVSRDGRLEELRFDFTANPVQDEHGNTAGVLVFGFEITDHIRTTKALAQEMIELQRLQARQRVLVSELQHRTRNLLAVIRAMAAQTFSGEAQSAVLASFLERLASIGRVQGLISRAEGQQVKLSDIVWAELDMYAEDRRSCLEVHGPAVRLSSHQVQTMALALHELATNAMKYGALQSPNGRLCVTWETWIDSTGQHRLALLWKESGVAVPTPLNVRRGHGRELIENSLRFSLHADTQLVFGADGVWCRIELPLETLHRPNHGTSVVNARR